MQLILDRGFSPLMRASQGFLLRRMVRSYEPYHPVFLENRQLCSGERACVDRWRAVEPYLRALAPASLLDLGCAEGYFVKQAATQLDCFALGIDADIRRLTVARMSTSLNGTERAAFMQGTVTPEFLNRLPDFDVTVFLSVMHHVMYGHGVDYARQIAAGVRRLTRKCMVFDMGQSDETQHAWSNLLPAKTSNPRAWIEAFLRSAGFGEIVAVGETDSYKGATRRHLFIAKP